jgi:hypothetical protein
MADLVTSVSTALSIASRLKKISENVKNAEFKNLLADLSLELADLKMKLADVLEENVKLHEKIKELQNIEGEPCPKCHKRGWQLKSSRPDSLLGQLGGIRRTYECSFCGFSEDKLVTPK